MLCRAQRIFNTLDLVELLQWERLRGCLLQKTHRLLIRESIDEGKYVLKQRQKLPYVSPVKTRAH